LSVLKPAGISRVWLTLAAALVLFEIVFLYEAISADAAGLQRIFGVFAGLATLCFAALLYSVSSIIYGWE
jgi:hypothetical protein